MKTHKKVTKPAQEPKWKVGFNRWVNARYSTCLTPKRAK